MVRPHRLKHRRRLCNEAALNGHVDVLGFRNDLTLGTNGYTQRSYSYRNSIAVTLGNGNSANPPIFTTRATPFSGGQYESGYLANQLIIGADTLHFNERLALQSVLNASFLSSRSYANTGVLTSAHQRNGALSPSESLIYRLTPKLTTYFTFAESIEQGDTAPNSGLNASQILAPYRDRLYEVGAKYAAFDEFPVTLAAFRMTRPFATSVGTNAGNSIFQMVGLQRNYGIELFGKAISRPSSAHSAASPISIPACRTRACRPPTTG